MHTGEQTLESMKEAQWYNNWSLDQFKNFLKGDILEVGSGIGNFTDKLSEYGQVYGIDIDDKYLKEKLKSKKRIKVGFGDIEKGKYFFKDKKFDTIVCLNVVEHIKDDHSAFKNIYKLLKKSGHLILIIPSNQSLYGEIDRSIGHFRRYDKKNLVNDLCKIGFKVMVSRRINFIGGVGWFVAGKIYKDNIVKKSKIKLFNVLAPLFLALEKIVEPPIGTSVFIIAQK